MKILFCIYLLSFSLLYSQHSVSVNWEKEALLPLSGEHPGAKQRGVLYNNNIATSTGRIIISTSEVNPTNVNAIFDTYFTYSDDEGKHWSIPKKFTPLKLVFGGSSPKIVCDSKDNIYVVWSSKNPDAIFISILDKNLNVIKDSIRVAKKQLHGNYAIHMTIDKKDRIHVMWHEGNMESGQTAESFNTRYTKGGLNWQTPVKLSVQDGKHSAFPHAEFDVAGDTLVIAWRDSVGSSKQWDVYGNISSNGGATWLANPIPLVSTNDRDWDPDVVVDNKNRVHLFYHVYPNSDPFNGARVKYQFSDNILSPSITWKYANSSVNNGVISELVRSQLVEGCRMDLKNNILWVTWKDERNFNFRTGDAEGDLVAAYSKDRGLTWTREFVTDKHDSTIAFKAGGLMPNGDFFVNYEVISPGNINDANGFLRVYFKKRKSVATSVKNYVNELPNNFVLYQNYPNPFNSSTTIKFQLIKSGNVSLKVYDYLGNEIKNILNENLDAGVHQVNYDASQLSSGIYFINLSTDNFVETKKMVLLK